MDHDLFSISWVVLIHEHDNLSHNKKNSCPLCQEEGIAKEVRSNDIEIGPHADTIQNADVLNGLSTGDD